MYNAQQKHKKKNDYIFLEQTAGPLPFHQEN
jgi:hypothetical protein